MLGFPLKFDSDVMRFHYLNKIDIRCIKVSILYVHHHHFSTKLEACFTLWCMQKTNLYILVDDAQEICTYMILLLRNINIFNNIRSVRQLFS